MLKNRPLLNTNNTKYLSKLNADNTKTEEDYPFEIEFRGLEFMEQNLGKSNLELLINH